MEAVDSIDSIAVVVAHRHAGGPAVTAAMDEVSSVTPGRVGEIRPGHPLARRTAIDTPRTSGADA